MSLPDAGRRSPVYVGTGSVRDFTFSFRIFAADQVTVQRLKDGEAVPSAVPPDEYAVSFAEDGGTVSFITPPAKGDMLVILSNVPYTQDLGLNDFGAFNPSDLTQAWDKNTALIQQIKDKVDKAVTIPDIPEQTPQEFVEGIMQASSDAADAADRAEASAQEAADKAEEVKTYSYDIPRVTDSLDKLAAGPDGLYALTGMGDKGEPGEDISNRVVKATDTTELRTLGARFADVINVKDFGAKGDGAADDTEAFKRASDLAARGAVVYVPTGSYVLSESVPGMFITNGFVKTSQALDVIDLNSYKTRGFVEALRLGMIFAYHLPKTEAGATFYLQGFCSDGERYVWFALITSDNANQKLVRLDTETGQAVVKDFTTLHHANGLAYYDGKLYVATLSTPSISVHDSNTLEQLDAFNPDGSPAGGGAVAFDSFTERFYYYSSAAVHVYSNNWGYVKTIPWTWPDWAPETGQSMGAYKGLLFHARSNFSDFPSKHEAIIVYDTDKCEVVYQWMIPGSFGELESVSFFKNKLLLGFNDGSHEMPFYTAIFDKTLPLLSPQSPESFSQVQRPFFGNLSQETIKIYVDATASDVGDGTQEKPFNSLKRAIWCARQPETAYRVAIYLSGDLTKNAFEYIQGMPRLTQLLPWGGKSEAVIPPLRILDSNVRLGAITVKGLDNCGGTVSAVNVENSEVDIRGLKFDPRESELTPNSYVNLNRGTMISFGMDFSLTGEHLPTRYVTCYSGASLILLAASSAFKFPTEAASVPRFYTYGNVCTQYADCRQLIVNNVYNGSKLASVFDSDGLNGTPTVNVPKTE